MRVVCVGGGPAGLYFAALLRRLGPGHDITVLERNPAGVTHGWGVVFSEALLTELFRTDPVAARQIRGAAQIWQDQHVQVGGQPVVHLGGYGYSIGRQRLLELLASRAVEVGVEVRFETDVEADPPEADLVVACDGVHSRIRRGLADRFGSTVTTGTNPYIWLGTPRLFDAFTFGFERTDAGWMWFHGYRFDDVTSTFIAECGPGTWRALGLDRATPQESTALLERVFARHLRGAPLLAHPPGQTGASWLQFTGISNERWSHGNVALMGDAAHTAHFSIGSGTTLAMGDAIVLAETLGANGSPGAGDALGAALADYHAQRRPVVETLQREAGRSARWFECVEEVLDAGRLDVGYSMLRRRFSPADPGDHTPQWRYGVYLATQRPALRGLRRQVTTMRRSLLDARRLSRP